MENSNLFFILGIFLLVASIVLYNVLQIRAIRRFLKNNFHKSGESDCQEKKRTKNTEQLQNDVLYPTVLLDEDEE